MKQPIKVRISESISNPKWEDDESEYVEIYGASASPTNQLIQYKMDVYGAAPYISELYFNNLGDAYKAWVTLNEETTMDYTHHLLMEYYRDTASIDMFNHTYNDAVAYMKTVEKFKYI